MKRYGNGFQFVLAVLLAACGSSEIAATRAMGKAEAEVAAKAALEQRYAEVQRMLSESTDAQGLALEPTGGLYSCGQGASVSENIGFAVAGSAGETFFDAQYGVWFAPSGAVYGWIHSEQKAGELTFVSGQDARGEWRTIYLASVDPEASAEVQARAHWLYAYTTGQPSGIGSGDLIAPGASDRVVSLELGGVYELHSADGAPLSNAFDGEFVEYSARAHRVMIGVSAWRLGLDHVNSNPSGPPTRAEMQAFNNEMGESYRSVYPCKTVVE